MHSHSNAVRKENRKTKTTNILHRVTLNFYSLNVYAEGERECVLDLFHSAVLLGIVACFFIRCCCCCCCFNGYFHDYYYSDILLLLFALHLLWLFTLNLLVVYFDNRSDCTRTTARAHSGSSKGDDVVDDAVDVWVMISTLRWEKSAREREKWWVCVCVRSHFIWQGVIERQFNVYSLNGHLHCAFGNNTNYIYNLCPHALHYFISPKFFLLLSVSVCLLHCWQKKGFQLFAMQHTGSTALNRKYCSRTSNYSEITFYVPSKFVLYRISSAVWFRQSNRNHEKNYPFVACSHKNNAPETVRLCTYCNSILSEKESNRQLFCLIFVLSNIHGYSLRCLFVIIRLKFRLPHIRSISKQSRSAFCPFSRFWLWMLATVVNMINSFVCVSRFIGFYCCSKTENYLKIRLAREKFQLFLK